ncbi:menaquinone-specific isochorismate synthase [Alkalibacillus filiformis]|uniref:Isochorismate synthase MenF n=1 Tax=Alkalibacillus filiformis TaxID=200990 RepID=A0ABU0DX04_9BACI|nr:isochorismate synthase [Alkalibacillus filiformis]MDQ0352936.1 menaquinone-specific isochorismate synthase [Alkalibacillus filiformis]
MLTTIERLSINEKLNEALSHIDEQGQFLSLTIEVSSINPIDYFASRDDLKGERFYWTSADGELTFVGLGYANQFYSTDSDERYQSIEQALQDQKQQMIQLQNEQIAGTGAIYFGGFSFFNERHHSEWHDFPVNQFVLPKRLLTVKSGKHYLSLNLWIEPNDSAENVSTMIETELDQVNGVQPFTNKEMSFAQVNDELTYEEWQSLIVNAVNEINDGKLDKVVLAREVEALFEEQVPVEQVLNALLEQQERSYIFVMENNNQAFIGATPERLVEVNSGELQSACLAGTTSRGQTVDEDEWKALELLKDDKNLEEHQYVVKMIQNSVSPLCDRLSIPNQPMIRKLSKIQHLFTPVSGTLKESVTIFDALKALHPTPALGGEPRQEAMDFIQQHEPLERGWYAAPIGWVDANFNGEFAVAIRSALLTGHKARLFAGCGIVSDSDPKAEYDETNLKFSPMLGALGGYIDDNE